MTSDLCGSDLHVAALARAAFANYDSSTVEKGGLVALAVFRFALALREAQDEAAGFCSESTAAARPHCHPQCPPSVQDRACEVVVGAAHDRYSDRSHYAAGWRVEALEGVGIGLKPDRPVTG